MKRSAFAPLRGTAAASSILSILPTLPAFIARGSGIGALASMLHRAVGSDRAFRFSISRHGSSVMIDEVN